MSSLEQSAVMRCDVLRVVNNAYLRMHEKHNYSLKLMAENIGVEKKAIENKHEGFMFARGKESACRELLGIFEEMTAELRQLSNPDLKKRKPTEPKA